MVIGEGIEFSDGSMGNTPTYILLKTINEVSIQYLQIIQVLITPKSDHLDTWLHFSPPQIHVVKDFMVPV